MVPSDSPGVLSRGTWPELPSAAYLMLAGSRQKASPSPAQLEAFRIWVSRRAERFSVPSLDVLGRFAWAA